MARVARQSNGIQPATSFCSHCACNVSFSLWFCQIIILVRILLDLAMDISQRPKENLTKLVQMQLLCKSSQCCLDLFMWMSYFVINKKLQLHCFYPKERTFLIDYCVTMHGLSKRVAIRNFIFEVSSFILMRCQSD